MKAEESIYGLLRKPQSAIPAATRKPIPEAQIGIKMLPIRRGNPRISRASCAAATKPKMAVATLLKDKADMRDLPFADV